MSRPVSPAPSEASSDATFYSAIQTAHNSSSDSNETIMNSDLSDDDQLNTTRVHVQKEKPVTSKSDPSCSSEMWKKTLYANESSSRLQPDTNNRANRQERHSSFIRFDPGSSSESESSELCDKQGVFDVISPAEPFSNKKRGMDDEIEDLSRADGSTMLSTNKTSSPTDPFLPLNSKNNTFDAPVVLEKKSDAHQIEGCVDEEVLNSTFHKEAWTRSNVLHEKHIMKNKSFDHINAINDEIESFGGQMPRRSQLTVTKSPSPILAATPPCSSSIPSSRAPSQVQGLLPAHPYQLTTHLEADSCLIKNDEDLKRYQDTPKEFFMDLLQKYLSSNFVSLPFAHKIASQFVLQMAETYKNKDATRYTCFSHLQHIGVENYTIPLFFLTQKYSTADYPLLENLFLRSTDMLEAAERCPQCQGENKTNMYE